MSTCKYIHQPVTMVAVTTHKIKGVAGSNGSEVQ